MIRPWYIASLQFAERMNDHQAQMRWAHQVMFVVRRFPVLSVSGVAGLDGEALAKLVEAAS